tara:strand:+ start:1751 stop:2953 length:1203 start_codon:yes stop_codon:yes gene_type:complete
MLKNQPIMNLGTLGPVSGGKSTLIKSLTGVKTQRFDSEKTRNITIKAGYANLKIVKNADGSLKSTDDNYTPLEDETMIHRLSFVDCPGHRQLTRIMLGQVNLMAGAIAIVSMAEEVSLNYQLNEHLKAAKLAGLNKIIVCLNKCDLVSKDVVKQKYNETLELFSKIGLEPPLCIIPTSFNRSLNINYLIEAIVTYFPAENYIEKSMEKPFFPISRSFDINKAGSSILKLKGGVVGGTLINGTLSVGDQVIIRPGNIIKRGDEMIATPIKTVIKGIMSEKSSLDRIQTGGLMAIATDINPHFTRSDRMVGNIICLEDDDRFVTTTELIINIKFIEKKMNLNLKDSISIQIGPLSVIGIVTKFRKKKYTINLNRPCCIQKGTTLYLSTNDDKMTIIGSCVFS